MTVTTLQIKNKVIGFQNPINSSEFGNFREETNTQDRIGNETEENILIDNADQHVIILEKQIKELESALQSAREESFQAGFEEGKENAWIEADQRLKDISGKFSSMIKSLKSQYDQALEDMSQPLLKFAGKIAEKIIGRELRYEGDYNEFFIKQIKQFFNEVTDQNKITIYLNSDQLEWVSKPDILKEINLPPKANIRFVENNTLNPGECLLETENCIVEGVLERELDNIERQILNMEIK